MDPFHARIARVALAAAEPYGFALAGGYAVQAHGFLDRPSADVHIFTTSRAEGDFPAAVDAVLAALRDDGLIPEAEIRNASFARIAVATPDGGTTKIEMGVDWRANQPSRLSIGPVLHPDDAVANKVCALFGRAEVRDYVDVDAIVSSGRYGEEELLSLAEAHDPGFDRQWFAEALAAVDRLPDDRFQLYGLAPAQAARLKKRLTDWSARIRNEPGCLRPSSECFREKLGRSMR
jgi:Nucleotidyl transferase AbiEii toxin, Type IV TA system